MAIMKQIRARLLTPFIVSLLAAIPAFAVNRSVTITAPSTPVHAGQTITVPTAASTDATDSEQIGFYHIEYSTNNVASWNAVAYDVNVGKSATRTATITTGAVGSVVVVRVKIAFRGGAAGDVDYTGAPINWGGSWNSWGAPPSKYAYINVVPNRTLTLSAPSSTVYAGQSITVTTSASTDAGGGEQLGFYHVEYSTDGGASWTAFCYDVNVGTSATRSPTITAGAAGTTIIVRARIAYRGGGAGDVDYNGSAINWGGSWNSWGTPPAKYLSISVVPHRIVTISTPTTTVYAGQTITVPTSASTDAGGGEQLGFYHGEYSTDGGVSWTGFVYDVNVGTSASRTATITAGASGSVIKVRVRIAFRGGAAGDVDYNGSPINWSGSWNGWGTPPAIYATINVAANQAPSISWSAAPTSAYTNQTFTVQAQGSDLDGNLSWVRIWRDGVLVADTNAGSTTTKNSDVVPAARATAGTITFTAQAGDTSGATSTTITRMVVISSSPTTTLLTASASGDYHIDATATKGGTPTDCGNGVLFEIYQHSGSTDTLLWSTVFARPNVALINLLVPMATGDYVYCKTTPLTTSSSNDTVTVTLNHARAANIGLATYSGASATVVTKPSSSAVSNIPTANRNAQGIQSLIDAAAAVTVGTYDRVEVVLPADTYAMQHFNGGESLLTISGAQNISLRGPGARLVVNEVTPQMFLSVDNSSCINIEDVEFDYEQSMLPFIQGTVTNVTALPVNSWLDGQNNDIPADSVTVTLDWTPTDTTPPTASRFSSLFGTRFDQTTANPIRVLGDGVFETKANSCVVSGTSATFVTNRSLLAPNNRVAMGIRGDTSRLQEAALRFVATTDCMVKNATLRAGGWISTILKQPNGMHFHNFAVAFASGSSRLITTNGDGVQCQNARRGPSLERCFFEGMMDDGVNFHGSLQSISAASYNGSTNETTLTVPTSGIAQDDVLMTYLRTTPDGGHAVGMQPHRVKSPPSGGQVVVDGDARVTDGGTTYSPTRFANLSTSSEGYIIRGSTFSRLRGFGGRIQTGYGLIADQNVFSLTSSLGISFEADLAQANIGEGHYANDVPVWDNSFSQTNYTSGQKSAIQVWGHNMPGPDVSPNVPAPIFVNVAGKIFHNSFISQDTPKTSVLSGPEYFYPLLNN